jgi:Peptidase_C39 like family
MNMKVKAKRLLVVLGIVIVLGVVIALPPVWVHIGWRLDNVVAVVNNWLHPPEKLIFLPAGSESTPTSYPLITPTIEITPTADFLATPTITPTSMPGEVLLSGVKFVHQHDKWNYCAPANMSMMLSYWGVNVSREAIAAVVKPFDEDKNVMPYELVDYVNQNTSLKALVRMGGDLDTLKNLLANHFVVLVEKAIFYPDTLSGKITWMGHYNTLVGYDDTAQQVITMDSLYGTAEQPSLGINLRIPYSEFINQWRDFNYIFLVVYPPEKENDVLNAIGPLADETTAFQVAAARAG